MGQYDVYAYGMIVATSSFLLEGGFIKPDDYAEIKDKYRLPGGETGSCATVLSSLGASVKMDGNHIGRNVVPLLREFYKDKTVNLDSLHFDEEYEGLEDYVIIADGVRSPMGSFVQFYRDAYEKGIKRWSVPKEEDIAGCAVAALDPFFAEEAELAAKYCVKHGKPYVTIDCRYDSYIHRHAAISVISGEGMQNNYPGKTREEMFSLFQDNSDGLTIITNGGKGFYYGRKGQEKKHFAPYKVEVVSTLGAGDTFKAGCAYALLKGMSDEDTVRFASACSAVAISRFPLPLYPPKLSEVEELISTQRRIR